MTAEEQARKVAMAEANRRWPDREVGGRDPEFGRYWVRPDKAVGFIEGAMWARAAVRAEVEAERDQWKRRCAQETLAWVEAQRNLIAMTAEIERVIECAALIAEDEVPKNPRIDWTDYAEGAGLVAERIARRIRRLASPATEEGDER